VKDLEVKINSLKHTRHVPTQTEVEFEAHLAQLTDHIIQKQAQVDTNVFRCFKNQDCGLELTCSISGGSSFYREGYPSDPA
jgi:hypothetical protein